MYLHNESMCVDIYIHAYIYIHTHNESRRVIVVANVRWATRIRPRNDVRLGI